MELLVSISIIALISGVFLANFHYSGQTGDLNMSAQKLVSDVRLVQNWSLGLEEFDSINDFPQGGWGIRFHRDDDKYVFFAEVTEDGHITGASEFFREISFFKEGVAVLGRLDIDGTNYNYAHVIFEPPDPIVHINGGPNTTNIAVADANQLEITLELENSSLTKKVIINKFGLIDIED